RERGSQVHDMAEFQEILDFPPAPKLDVFGKLDPKRATPAELRGQAVFFGKGQCATCHLPPYYTDNLMHNLRAERFFKPQMINGMMAAQDGPIKTFPLRGIKDSPPYLHDGRLLTLDDTVEFFNLVLSTKLTEAVPPVRHVGEDAAAGGADLDVVRVVDGAPAVEGLVEARPLRGLDVHDGQALLARGHVGVGAPEVQAVRVREGHPRSFHHPRL